MFTVGTQYAKLKTNLRLVINRLKLLEKKKTELTQKSRKEIADYIAGWSGSYFVVQCIRTSHIEPNWNLQNNVKDLISPRAHLASRTRDAK